MSRFKTLFAGILAGFLLLALTGTSEAAAVKPKAKVSICDTGSRADKAYRIKCMRYGTTRDALRLWRSTPLGKKGQESVNKTDRRSICKMAPKFGGIKTHTREMYFDTAYDTFHNHDFVLIWVGIIAKVDCERMGYRV